MSYRSRRRLPVALAAVALGAGIALVPIALAQNSDGGPGRGPGGGGNAPPAREGRPQGPSIEGAMKGMNRALKQLNGQIGDAARKDENLRLINDMQRLCVTAKGLPLTDHVYEKAGAKDEAGKASLNKAFRVRLIALLKAQIEVEEKLADGKADEAKALLGRLIEIEEAGHKEMGIGDD